MQYICERCEQFFDTPKELKNMGGDIGESVFVCPCCGHDEYEEVVECAVCGDVIRENESNNCVCESCLAKFAGYKHAKNLGNKCRTFEFLNGFLLYVFNDEKDIENILTEAMLKRFTPSEIEEKGKEFCREDDYEFADYLKKEGCYL